MSIDELERELEITFHDALLREWSVDICGRIATFALDIWIGNPDAKEETLRELRRSAVLRLEGVQYIRKSSDSWEPQQWTVSCDFEKEGNMPLPNPKRLFRVSLRTAFVLTTVLCVWLGFKVHPAKQQQEAVAWVMERGGHVIYDFEFDGDVIAIPYAKPPGPDWLRDILGVDYFARPHWIELHDQRLANLSPLAQLDGLWCLQVSSKSLNDISALSELTNLEHLALACRDTPDLTPLANLTRLKRLHLWMAVKDEDLAWLRDALPQCAIYQELAKWK